MGARLFDFVGNHKKSAVGAQKIMWSFFGLKNDGGVVQGEQCGAIDYIDFGRDLPGNIFCNDEYRFYFFERPILDWVELFIGLAKVNSNVYACDLIVGFGDLRTPESMSYVVRSRYLQADLEALVIGFSDFFDGGVGYPVTIFNASLDWFAFESSSEELGVLALRSDRAEKEFESYLKKELIDCNALLNISKGGGVYSRLAAALVKEYCY